MPTLSQIKIWKNPISKLHQNAAAVFGDRNINLRVVGMAKLCAPLDWVTVIRQIISFFPSRATPLLRKWSVGGTCFKELCFIHHLSQIYCALSAFCFQKECEITCFLDKNLSAGWLPIHQTVHWLCFRPSQVFWSLGSCALTSVLFLLQTVAEWVYLTL